MGKDCEELLKDNSFSDSEPYTFSVVFVQVEKFLYQLADLYLKPETAASRTKCQSETLISVVTKLSEKIESFSKIQKAFLTVELRSRRVLIFSFKF